MRTQDSLILQGVECCWIGDLFFAVLVRETDFFGRGVVRLGSWCLRVSPVVKKIQSARGWGANDTHVSFAVGWSHKKNEAGHLDS